MVKYLKLAYDALQQPITHFLESSRPDWVLFDFAPYWLGPIAAQLDISTAFFSIFIAAVLAFVDPPSVSCDHGRTKPEDFTVPPKWIPFSTTVACRLFEVLRMNGDDGEKVSDLYRIGATIEGCDVVAVRSCSELEPEWLQLLTELYRKPVIPVGLLPTTGGGGGEDMTDRWRATKEWLDKQAKGSVVYVAFGSEVKPNQTELTEIAHGLELSGLPFFWVLRNRRGLADTELTELPEGFEERTKGRGVVCTSWAPQFEILSHDSVGGVLTHSGWSTVVEAVQFERALILLTFLLDQGLHASFLVEKKMAYLIPRDERDGSFTGDLVAESLRLVMVAQEGKMYRDKVKEMRGLFGDRDRQDRYVDNFLGFLLSHSRSKAKRGTSSK
uniref:Soyasaponin III rhamnosyltransferase n=1 Tax=Davidia involucrata TaxID=16924 RepID=A0A5B6ZI97_DAVIN